MAPNLSGTRTTIMNAAHTPSISVIVIIYRMSRQAINTLYSLSAQYQKNVSPNQYEVIVIENESDDMIDPDYPKSLGSNFHYLRHQPTNRSPVSAINIGFDQARGNFIGLIIDGARIVTPRVIEYALMASRLPSNPLLSTATFHLGPYLHHETGHNNFGIEEEQTMLSASNWRNNGYRLFDIANVGEANPVGYYQPLLESNCFFTTRSNFDAIGYADPSFDLPGGGSVNVHMFRSIGMLPQCKQFIVMAGEGSFHQQHGGVTTTTESPEQREEKLEAFRREINARWEGKFHALEREPLILGSINQSANDFALYSSIRGEKRLNKLYKQGCYFYQDDFFRTEFTYQRRNTSFNKPAPR